MKRALLLIAAIALVGAAPARPDPSLGKAEAACRANEAGPALMITAIGLKDRAGLLRAELYPDNDADFLQDDAILVNQGKTFRRVDLTLTASNAATLCLRVPAAGRYAMSLLHDRDRNLKFSLFSDGIGFSGNPRLTRAKPRSASAIVAAGPGITHVAIRMNYLRGFMRFGPVAAR